MSKMKRSKNGDQHCKSKIDLSECISCAYLQCYNDNGSIPYTIDENGIKHRDIAYCCLYDMHLIKNQNHCTRGGCLHV